jgi:ankyrin repeat protein
MGLQFILILLRSIVGAILVTAAAAVTASADSQLDEALLSTSHTGTRISAKVLLTLGANPCALDQQNNTPIGNTISRGELSIFEVLLDSAVKQGCRIHLLQHDGKSILFEAVRFDRARMVTHLLHFGVDANSRTPENLVPLHWASSPRVIDLLLAHGARINESTLAGNTALIFSAARNLTGVSMHLISRGADVNVIGSAEPFLPLAGHLPKQWSPILLAANRNNPILVKSLLENYAQPLESFDGISALSIAQKYENTPQDRGIVHLIRMKRLQRLK